MFSLTCSRALEPEAPDAQTVAVDCHGQRATRRSSGKSSNWRSERSAYRLSLGDFAHQVAA